MRINKRHAFYDTSILSRIAWTQAGDSEEQTKKRWNEFLDDMDKLIPGFSEQNYELVATDALFMEIIGLGSVKDKSVKKGKNYAFSSNSLKSHVKDIEWKNYVSDPEAFVKCLVRGIDSFIKNELKPRNLYRQARLFQESYVCHENSHFILARVKRWRKNIDNQSIYANFRNNIMWDTIFKYPFIDVASMDSKERLDAMIFWAGVLGIMFKEYYEIYKENYSLEVSALGLFSEVNRIGGFDKQKRYDRLLKQWSDMVDAESIHFALIGKRKKLFVNEPVIVITCDKKEDVQRRLECLYKNLNELAEKGLKIDICPGVVILFLIDKDDTVKFDSIINVQDFINTLSPE